jgi:methionyl-tRNA formyltransferase
MSSERKPVFFIGCVQSSEVALKTLLVRPEIEVVGVLTLQSSTFNSDFVDIATVAAEAGVLVYYAEETDEQLLANILRKNEVKIVFTIGWSRLLGTSILKIPCFGFVGFHPAALPQNRGRHPLIWALALGLEQTASTLFIMDEEPDSGPIVSQKQILITPQEDAQSLYNKILAVLPEQINSIVDRLTTEDLKTVPQQSEYATAWRKRGAPDGLIDWRMSAEAIYNLTRALTRPYIGAEFYYNKVLVKLWSCEVFTGDVPRNVEPGKVLQIDDCGPVIKTGMGAGGGALRLLETENFFNLQKGDYL